MKNSISPVAAVIFAAAWVVVSVLGFAGNNLVFGIGGIVLAIGGVVMAGIATYRKRAVSKERHGS